MQKSEHESLPQDIDLLTEVEGDAETRPTGEHYYEVIVGNLGSVYSGANRKKATETFRAYAKQSKAGYGRAAGEEVWLLADDEIEREFTPSEAAAEEAPPEEEAPEA